jgi:hypothetical protein
LPCNSNELDHFYDNIWSKKEQRRTGSCYDNFRVMVFDSIFDYINFMNHTLTHKQHLIVKKLLVNNTNKFLSIKKKNLKCYKMYEDYPRRIIDYYNEKFLNKMEESISTNNDSMNMNLVANIEKLTVSYIQMYVIIITLFLVIIIISVVTFKLINLKNIQREQGEPLI